MDDILGAGLPDVGPTDENIDRILEYRPWIHVVQCDDGRWLFNLEIHMMEDDPSLLNIDDENDIILIEGHKRFREFEFAIEEGLNILESLGHDTKYATVGLFRYDSLSGNHIPNIVTIDEDHNFSDPTEI